MADSSQDLAEAQRLLKVWLDAEEAIATGASYTIGSRSLTRANLDQVVKRVTYYRALVTRLARGSNTGVSIFRVMPRDI